MRSAIGALGIVAVIVAVVAAAGCARLVVVDPATVQKRNDATWQVVERPNARNVSAVGDGPPGSASVPGVADPSVTVVSPLPPAVSPAPRATVPPIPKAVLETPRDRYGVPQGLYQQDPMLGAYLQVLTARAASHRAAGGGALAFGVVTAGLSALLFWRATVNADAVARAHANGQSVSSDPSGMQYFWGVADGALSLGFLGFGIAELATGTDASSLQRYSHETYGVP